MFRVCPEMGVEPVQLIGPTSAHGVAKDRFIWVENDKLLQEFFGFAQRVRLLGITWLESGVSRGALTFEDAAPEKFACHPLFPGETVI